MIPGAVLRLSHAEVREGHVRLDQLAVGGGQGLADFFLQILERRDRRFARVGVDVALRQFTLQLEPLLRIRFRANQREHAGDFFLRLVPLVVPYAFAGDDGGQFGDHVVMRAQPGIRKGCADGDNDRRDTNPDEWFRFHRRGPCSTKVCDADVRLTSECFA